MFGYTQPWRRDPSSWGDPVDGEQAEPGLRRPGQWGVSAAGPAEAFGTAPWGLVFRRRWRPQRSGFRGVPLLSDHPSPHHLHAPALLLLLAQKVCELRQEPRPGPRWGTLSHPPVCWGSLAWVLAPRGPGTLTWWVWGAVPLRGAEAHPVCILVPSPRPSTDPVVGRWVRRRPCPGSALRLPRPSWLWTQRPRRGPLQASPWPGLPFPFGVGPALWECELLLCKQPVTHRTAMPGGSGPHDVLAGLGARTRHPPRWR